MPLEIEIKLRVADHDLVRDRLRAAGAERVGVVTETNRFFDDGSLAAGGCGLRVRTNAGDAGQRHVVTFKGPRQPGELKIREEIEFDTNDAAATAAVLEKLGLSPALSFAKTRETWRLGGCTVELDDLPELGRFTEIEGPTEAAVLAVRSTLGLDDAAVEPEGYATLIARRR